MNGDIDNLAPATGSKVSLSDTDHLCGICGDAGWPWRSLMRGHNTLLMDGYDGSPGVGDPNYHSTEGIWEIIRTYMGYARSFAQRVDLAHALPHGELASSTYCLAVPDNEYLVLLPTGVNVTVDLSGLSGSRTVEWFQPKTNETVMGANVTGGSSVTFTSPFSGGNVTILYIHP
ncbi:MAG TPA: putative collagen-binding domain-containing protein, partial [Gemmatimonadaceae bacterium]|nr:putative collagen-binding domain-containing protein [Gemmatimonadaceae bacterium]